MSRLLPLALLAAAALLPSCGHLSISELLHDLDVVDRDLSNLAKSTMPIGYEEELAYGGSIATEIVAAYGGLYEEPRVVNYVNTVGQTVAAFSERPHIPYYFGILDTDEVNALSAPGGYVFITRALLASCEDEAQLAAVLAHEVGHIAGRHGLKIIRRLKTSNQALQISNDDWMDVDILGELVGKFLTDYLARGLPKKTEFDADRRATEILVRLGYHGSGLRDFLAALPPQEEDPDDRWYKTHPEAATRIQRLDALLADLGKVTNGEQLARRFKRRTRALKP